MKDVLSRYPRDFSDGLTLRPMEPADEQALRRGNGLREGFGILHTHPRR